MAVGFRLDFARMQQINANSEVLSGAKLHVYSNLTTTPVTLYSDRAVTTTAANPIVADSSGRFPFRYVATDDLLTLDLDTSADVDVWSDNYVEPVPSNDNSDLANYLALAGGTMTGAVRFAEGSAVASATSINLDASGGNFNHISGTTTISTITLAQGAMRWAVFDGILTLTHSVNLILPKSTNIVTVAGDAALFVGEGSGVVRLLWYRCENGKPLVESGDFPIKIGDESTALAAATGVITFRLPYAMTLDAIPQASLTTASSSGAVTIDINVNSSTILSTKLTVDEGELSSTTANVPAVLSSTSIAANSIVSVDIDGDGTGPTGLQVTLMGVRHNRQ